MKTNPRPIDLAAIRHQLQNSTGRRYWRSLDEVAETPEFRQWLYREFPEQASEWTDANSRRNFLRLMGASLALAGVSGACTIQPREEILPYVRAPEEIIPGKPLFFASAMPLYGEGRGILVESHMGRPTKVEGNPEHPGSLGGTDVFAQASVLNLYDPDRSQTVTHLGEIRSYEAFLSELGHAIQDQRGSRGSGLRILSETVTSPTLAAQLAGLQQEFPLARSHQYEPVNRDNVHEGARIAFGEVLDPVYHLERAEVILSLDSDFLSSGPGSLRYTRDFSERRRVRDRQNQMSRLYVVESTPTNTGAMGDHRLPLAAREIELLTDQLASELGIRESQEVSGVAFGDAELSWIRAVARDLAKHRGSGLVIAGPQQPPVVHASVHAINDTLGNPGNTVSYIEPVAANPASQTQSLGSLVHDMQGGKVELLLILGGNPVFNAPVDFGFKDALSRVPLRIHLGLYQDETSAECHWHVPAAHDLEAWSDVRAYDGTATIIQPLIAPLYDGKSAHELMAAFTRRADQAGYDLVKDHWRRKLGFRQLGASDKPESAEPPEFQSLWSKALHDGCVPNTQHPPRAVNLKSVAVKPPTRQPAGAQDLELVFHPDPHIGDGRYANNGWLQELPKPLTRLTWENVALVSPAVAERLALANGEVVELEYQGRALKVPVWILPGQPLNTVTVHFGYGRSRTGRVGSQAGFNAYALRTSEAPWFGSGLRIQKTGGFSALASTQEHFSMEGRHPVRISTLQEYRDHPQTFSEMGHAPPGELTLYPETPYQGYAWGMTIDLNACTGCNACVVACQSENNIPIVGKEQVAMGREMHWIRVDRYFTTDEAHPDTLENPQVVHQPIPCMHCENAPCEVVCPVAATTHSDEGLNDMTYNRCVGTRYCANNCPYKVRRFNFLHYADYETPSLKLGNNPDVTVRSRGVMEKCTYCVQRINEVRIHAKRDGRQIRDGEIATACESACPARAITFGNINDPASRVSQLKAEARNYALLEDTNTRPRTSYLAKLTNPNPEIADGSRHGNKGPH